MTCSKCLGHIRAQKKKPTMFCSSCISESIELSCGYNNFYVYKLLDAKRRTIYVGYTSNLFKRFQQHAKTKTFWYMVAVKSFVTEEAAVLCETELIARLQPVCNVRRVKTVAPVPPTPLLETSDLEGVNSRLPTNSSDLVTYCNPCVYNGFSN